MSNILIDYSAKDMKLSEIFNRICFMCYPLIDAIDELRESTAPVRQLKFHLKGVESEIQKITADHARRITEGGGFTDENGITHTGEDMLLSRITAYTELFSRPSSEILGVNEIVKRAEKNGIDFNKVEVFYDPVKK